MEQHKEMGHWRKSYEKGILSDDLKSVSPWVLFTQWLEEAQAHPAIEEANAMSIVTMGEDGFPKARVVLLKQYSEKGLIFYTNYASDKGRAIAAHPKVGISFFWPALERQIIIKGTAKKVSDKVSDAYFASRPKGSRLGAIVSQQSTTIANRELLTARLAALEKEYQNKTPERPAHWGGYSVQPTSIEFWQGRPNRLHDRLQFTQMSSHKWEAQRLAP
ncbi:MAG: pyridoxamine 5'-phosphate oxidase [Flavobacteriaceae bacterium]